MGYVVVWLHVSGPVVNWIAYRRTNVYKVRIKEPS